MGFTEILVPPAVDISRRFRLRAATRAEHARLDALITSAGFLTTRPRYLAYLAATLNAREAIERALDAAGVVEVYPDWPLRGISACLRRDLDDLDHAPTLPVSGFAVSGRAAILGTLYVLEGASLGARLLQGAAADMGLHATFGARHMAAQTADSRVWPRFTSLLDAAVLDAAGEAACHQSAVLAFKRFERSYRQALVEA
jgi:heme oxygenase